MRMILKSLALIFLNVFFLCAVDHKESGNLVSRKDLRGNSSGVASPFTGAFWLVEAIKLLNPYYQAQTSRSRAGIAVSA